MEYNNQNETPQTSSTIQKNRTAGVVVGIVVGEIVVVGMYMYIKDGKRGQKTTPLNQQAQEEITTPQQTPSQADVQDTTSAIQNDLQGIDASGINSDLQDINQQLNNL